MSILIITVSYFWGIRDYSFAKENSKDSLYTYINNESYRVANKYGNGEPANRMANNKLVDARVANINSPAYRRGSPAFRRKGRLKRQG